MKGCVALDRAALRAHPLPAVEEADKDAHGRLLLIAGSRETPGSAVLAATAALRAGCGKVSIATVEPLAAHVAMAVPEARVISVPMARDGGFSRSAADRLRNDLGQFDAVVAGPGMTEGKGSERILLALLEAGPERLILDAALLHCLAPHDGTVRSGPAPILLPHDREMASLLGRDEIETGEAPLQFGFEAAQRYQALVLAKGTESHVVTPEGQAFKYEGGGPGLGVSGSGDTLAGIAGGLLARGAEPLAALLWSVWLHGEAGARLGKKVGAIGYLAREIAGEIPRLLEEAQPSFK